MTDRRTAIQEAFVNNMRTVVMVDDEFPSFSEACSGKATTRKETARAVALWNGFRDLGMACEVENSPVPPPEFLKKGDLVILDYHLAGDDDNGIEARRLLRALADGGRQHLVVIYTSEPNIRDVRLKVAATVAGVPAMGPPMLTEDEQEDYDDWRNENKYELSEAALVKYIRRDSRWIGECMKDFGSYRGDRARLRQYLQRLAHYKAEEYGATFREADPRIEVSDTPSAWVRCDNVFVVVVQKGAEAPSSSGEENAARFLRDRLVDALCEWNPSFLRVMLNYARHCIVEQGFVGDDRVLRTPVSEAGWLLYMSGGVPEERRERVVALYGRLFEDLVVAALHKIEDFSAGHAPNFGEANVSAEASAVAPEAAFSVDDAKKPGLAEARLRAGVSEQAKDEDIVHALNEFLAFEEEPPAFVRTGTVFATANGTRGSGSTVWICTTPDCDLVPRNPSGWSKRLQPYMPALCRPVSFTKDFRTTLERAEDACGLFRTIDGAPQVIQLVTDKVGHRRPEMFFFDNSGRIRASGEFVGRTVAFNNLSVALELGELTTYKVIGQLRARYAMRLLHEAGHHLSRIGVDFVDWPPRQRDGKGD